MGALKSAGGYGSLGWEGSWRLGPGAGWEAAVHLSMSCRSASLSLAAASWKALASCCILDNWSAMAWIAATWWLAGWRTTEG